MQTLSATVVAVRGNKLTVSVENTVACARCAEGKGCGAGLLGSSSGPSSLELDAPDDALLRAGDIVCLTMESEDLLRASWLAYGFPMVSVVGALALLRLIADGASDVTEIGTAAAVFAISHIVARGWLRRDRCVQRLTPTVKPVGKE